MEYEDAQTKRHRYLIIGGVVGITLGLSTAESVGLPAGAVHLAWSAIAGAIGVLLGYLFVLASRAEEAPVQRPVVPSAEPLPPSDRRSSTSSTIRILAINPESSTADLRPIRIDQRRGVTSAPEVELDIMMEDFHFQKRIPVHQGVLKRMTAEEIADRVLQDIIASAPRTSKEPHFHLTALRSEGPFFEDGRCLAGWTFYFVDGRIGLGCTATSTQEEILLQFHTTPTFFDPEPAPWVDPTVARRLVVEAFPELADRELFYHHARPRQTSVFIWNPLFILDVDVKNETIRNVAAMRKRMDAGLTPENERFALQDVLAWLHGERREDIGAHFEAALESKRFQEGLRTLDETVLRRVARSIIEAEGPEVVALLEAAIREADNTEDQVALTRLLGFVPSGLALVALQRLATSSTLAKSDAEHLFKERAAKRYLVPSSPFERFTYEEVRAAMGKHQLVPVALRSTYDPDNDLVPPLAEVGLTLSRHRRLSGSRGLTLSAQFRSTRGDTEALLSSVPLPVPCHVLYLVGTNVEVFAKRLRNAELAYPIHEIFEDAASSNPTVVHRACLYLDALKLSPSEGAEPLIAAYRRGRRDRRLRHAVLRALVYTQDIAAERFLTDLAGEVDGEDQTLAKGLIEARRKWMAHNQDALSETRPISISGDVSDA